METAQIIEFIKEVVLGKPQSEPKDLLQLLRVLSNWILIVIESSTTKIFIFHPQLRFYQFK